MPDPIETARQELKTQQRQAAAAEAGASAAQAISSPAEHTKRPFRGANGKTYERRADIKMREYLSYTQERIVTIHQEVYWVALFIGLLGPETIGLSVDERRVLGEAAVADLVADDYIAIRNSVFDDITDPAASVPGSKSEAGPDAPMTQETSG